MISVNSGQKKFLDILYSKFYIMFSFKKICYLFFVSFRVTIIHIMINYITITCSLVCGGITGLVSYYTGGTTTSSSVSATVTSVVSYLFFKNLLENPQAVLVATLAQPVLAESPIQARSFDSVERETALDTVRRTLSLCPTNEEISRLSRISHGTDAFARDILEKRFPEPTPDQWALVCSSQNGYAKEVSDIAAKNYLLKKTDSNQTIPTFPSAITLEAEVMLNLCVVTFKQSYLLVVRSFNKVSAAYDCIERMDLSALKQLEMEALKLIKYHQECVFSLERLRSFSNTPEIRTKYPNLSLYEALN